MGAEVEPKAAGRATGALGAGTTAERHASLRVRGLPWTVGSRYQVLGVVHGIDWVMGAADVSLGVFADRQGEADVEAEAEPGRGVHGSVEKVWSARSGW